jgi:hypothetical protein
MKTKLEIGNRVLLKSFNGTTVPEENTRSDENYWKLISSTGTVVQDPTQKGIYAKYSKERRVLVQFDQSVKSINLECHNNVENSLWIRVEDLEILNNKI